MTGNCVGKRMQNYCSASAALSPRARVNMLTAERRAKNQSTQLHAKHEKSVQSSTRVTSNIVGPLPGRSFFVQESAGAGPAIQTLGSRRSRTEPPREELARTGRLLGTEQGRARHNPRGLCGVRRSRRDSARSLAWADCFRTPVLPNAAGGAALRYGKDVATTAVVSTWSAQRTRRRATQQRSQQAQTTPSSPSNGLRGVAKRQSRQTGP